MKENVIRYLLLANFLFFQTSAFANELEGFYIGANVGNSSAAVKAYVQQQINVQFAEGFPQTLNFTNNQTLGSHGLLGGLNAGYGKVIYSNFYLGVEGRINGENVNANSTVPYSTGIPFISNISASSWVNVSLTQDIDLLVKPGYLLRDQALLYAVGGLALGKFNSNVENNYVLQETAVIPDPTFQQTLNQNTSKHKLGFLIGIGIEEYLTKGFSVNLEYDFINYGTVIASETLSASAVDPTGLFTGTNFNSSLRTTVVNNQVILGLNYHFL